MNKYYNCCFFVFIYKLISVYYNYIEIKKRLFSNPKQIKLLQFAMKTLVLLLFFACPCLTEDLGDLCSPHMFTWPPDCMDQVLSEEAETTTIYPEETTTNTYFEELVNPWQNLVDSEEEETSTLPPIVTTPEPKFCVYK